MNQLIVGVAIIFLHIADPDGGRGSGPPPPFEKIQNREFLSNTRPGPLKESQNYLSPLKKSRKPKRCQSWTPSDKTSRIRACIIHVILRCWPCFHYTVLERSVYDRKILQKFA